MLRELKVENYLIIDNLEIEFSSGLNTITGETGAGKSIILGAINLLFGARADQSTLRSKDKKCVVEAVFVGLEQNQKLAELLSQAEIEQEGELTIRRVISQSIKSKYFVNQEPVNQSFVKELGALVVDIHSQHQTLLLGSSDFQVGVLDRVADNGGILAKYQSAYTKYISSLKELESLKAEAHKETQQQEYITFQYNQLSDAKLEMGQQQHLEERYSILANAQTISQSIQAVLYHINDSEESVISKLNIVKGSLNSISDFVGEAQEYRNRVESAILELKDICYECGALGGDIDQSSGELESISQRLDSLSSLCVKFGVVSADELIALRDQYQSQLDAIGDFDSAIHRAQQTVSANFEEAVRLAKEISQRRQSVCGEVEKFIVASLANLGMTNSRLVVEISSSDTLLPLGIDLVEFLFSANLGKSPESISKVASGGEMSRLMLALKSLISKHSDMQTLVFDEIDSGVSGRVADEMGQIINSMSSTRQIINITHLPQIAAKGDTHFVVSKVHSGDTTTSSIDKLTSQQRIEEIAKMLSGSTISEHARDQAKLMLEQ